MTFGCDELIMGKSRRSFLARAVEGDVVSRIARQLPEDVSLITRAGGPVRAVARAAAKAEEGENGDEPPPS